MYHWYIEAFLATKQNVMSAIVSLLRWRRTELSTLSHSAHLYNHEQQSLRFVDHPYNFKIANKTIKMRA